MAAIDKMTEFYTTAKRFAYLAEFYTPENTPLEIKNALDVLVKYVNNDKDFNEKLQEAQDWFDEITERIEMHKRKDLLAYLIKECTR